MQRSGIRETNPIPQPLAARGFAYRTGRRSLGSAALHPGYDRPPRIRYAPVVARMQRSGIRGTTLKATVAPPGTHPPPQTGASNSTVHGRYPSIIHSSSPTAHRAPSNPLHGSIPPRPNPRRHLFFYGYTTRSALTTLDRACGRIASSISHSSKAASVRHRGHRDPTGSPAYGVETTRE